MKFYLEKNEKCWNGKFSHFPKNEIIHAISSRFNGYSIGEFSGLNLAMHNGDNNKIVAKNRMLFTQSLGLEVKDIVTAQQTHSNNVVIVTAKMSGLGAVDYASALADTDALITNVKNLPLMMFFADCVPVLFYDPKNKVVAISHAGWKGTVSKIAQKTAMMMRENFGTNFNELLVGIGPSIGSCCYQVGVDVTTKVRANFSLASELLTEKNDAVFLDLWQANKLQLLEIGLKESNIVSSSVCNNCNSELLYSYRADNGKTGRIAAIISLK